MFECLLGDVVGPDVVVSSADTELVGSDAAGVVVHQFQVLDPFIAGCWNAGVGCRLLCLRNVRRCQYSESMRGA